MKITLLHPNKAKIERGIFVIQLILNRKLSICFQINKPISFDELELKSNREGE